MASDTLQPHEVTRISGVRGVRYDIRGFSYWDREASLDIPEGALLFTHKTCPHYEAVIDMDVDLMAGAIVDEFFTPSGSGSSSY